MQVDHHIRACPVIREAAGEEPYPQPSVIFATAPSGTVSVRIYDFSVQPPVELTSTALSGAELSTPTLTGLSNNYTLDMGHANVTAVVDAYSSEGLECVVAFQDSGTAADRYVKVTCNDADHIAALYPEQAIYAVTNSGNTGTTFPVGSAYLPAEDLGDACTVFTARSATVLDCKGSWNGGGSGSGGCREADIGTHLSSVGALIRTRSTASWYPHSSGEVIDLVDCQVLSVNVPYGFALGNFTNGTYFAGSPKLVNCRLQTLYLTGNGSSRSGSGDLTECKLDGDVYLSSFQSPGCWAFDAINCVNGTAVTLDCSAMGGSTVSLVGCSGDWQIDNMASGKAISMTGIEGMPDITLDSSTNSNLTVTLTGAYNQLVNNTGGGLTSLTERKLAGYSDLTGNVVNLAAGSVTATEAPNLDAAITTRSDFDVASDQVIVATNNDKTGYTMAGTLTSLDALDTAQDTQHTATQSAISALVIPSTAQITTAAEAAITNSEPISTDVAQVAGVAVSGVADFRADVSTLATSAALTSTEGTITTRLSGIEGATFDTVTDSLEALRNNQGSGGLTAQETRDAMMLAPTAGAPAAGSVDEHLDTIEAAGGGGSTIGPELLLKAPTLERPTASATEVYTVIAEIRNGGALADPVSNAVNVTCANALGADRSTNLGAATMTRLRAGQYSVTYSVAGTHSIEQIVFTIDFDFGGTVYTFTETASVLDTSGTQPSLVLSGS